MTGRTWLRVARRLGRDHPRILREKATDSVDLEFHTIRPGADQERVRRGLARNQNTQLSVSDFPDALINGRVLAPFFLGG
jgi:hypothetical protein